MKKNEKGKRFNLIVKFQINMNNNSYLLEVNVLMGKKNKRWSPKMVTK